MATEMKRSGSTTDRIEELLGDDARALLDHKTTTIPKEQIYLPGPDFVDRVVSESDRSPAVLRSLQSLLNHGRLAGTGYVSILPVDQGIEHSAGASFAPNPQFRPSRTLLSWPLWWLQRRRLDLRCAGKCGPKVRAQNSIHR